MGAVYRLSVTGGAAVSSVRVYDTLFKFDNGVDFEVVSSVLAVYVMKCPGMALSASVGYFFIFQIKRLYMTCEDATDRHGGYTGSAEHKKRRHPDGDTLIRYK